MLEAHKCFLHSKYPCQDDKDENETQPVANLQEVKHYLDIMHIRECLIKPYNENRKNYPLVDVRSLLPSFDQDPFEYSNLPGFSMLVLDRELHSFNEFFQYDPLLPVSDVIVSSFGPCCPLENQVFSTNMQTFLSRLPRCMHEEFRPKFKQTDTTLLKNYPKLLPHLLEMDRAHVMSKTKTGQYQLSGIFASFPSDLDGELKRYGLRIGKFQNGNSEIYLRNRLFTLQFLMELYGFPVASERRTSSALFARRLHKTGENFIIRVLGQSDRTLTTIWNDNKNNKYPKVEKIALVKIEDQDNIQELKALNAFIDPKHHVAIARITYHQHDYSPTNVRQDRALSVHTQTIIHPDSGMDITDLNFLRDTASLLLSLNDIAKGEFIGKTIYKRTEVIEGSESEEKRLKVFYAWLLKHQRRIISYSDDTYANFLKLFDNYFDTIQDIDAGNPLYVLKTELRSRFYYIQQARKLRDLEDIAQRNLKNVHLSYEAMLTEAVNVLREYKFDLFIYFEDLLTSAITLTSLILNDRYIQRTYAKKTESQLTAKGLEIKKKYGTLVQLLDELTSIQKTQRSEDYK